MPIPSFLKPVINRNLPNGGGSYVTANSTPMGVDIPNNTNNFDLTKTTPQFQGEVAPPQAQPVPEQAPVITPESQPGQASYTPSPNYRLTHSTQEAGNGPVDYLDQYRKLALEQAMHSSQGTGLYALAPGVQYSPDQIMAQRKAADDIYNQTLGEYSKAAQKQLTEQKKTPLYGIDSDLAGLSTNAVNTLYKMSDDFNSHPIVKDFNIIQRASSAANNILSDINSRPGKQATAGDDMSLMYLFAKAQDPNSVVRESEYSNVGDYFSSLPQAVQFKLSQIYKSTPDGRLTDTARTNIAHGIQTLYKTNKEQYDNLRSNAVDHMKRVAGKDVSSAFLNNYEDAYKSNNNSGSDSNNAYAEQW